jgi:hypothetical protein
MKLNVIFLLLLVSISYAHLAGGEDKVVDGYLVDFGHDSEMLEAGKPVILAFNLVDDTTKSVIKPEDVWIRISSVDDVIFAGTFAPQPESVSFSYTFPAAGEYEITARFLENNATIVETDFSVTVEQDMSLIIILITLLFVFLLFRLS